MGSLSAALFGNIYPMKDNFKRGGKIMIKTKKRFLSVGLAVLMLLAAVMLVIPAAGVKAAWDGSVAANFAGGNGTEANPYLISNAKELALLAEYVDLGNDTASTYYKLTADIDVSGGSEWTAIGTHFNRFKGTFDGGGHTVSGININKPNEEYQGLFGYSEGIIKNVGVENSSIIGKVQVGGICGSNEGTIEGCYNTGDIKATSNGAGGICGYNNDANAKIKNCYNTGTLDGDVSGGICGANMNGSISDCYNAGKVSGRYFVGSICGRKVKGTTIATCYNSKDICSIGGIENADTEGAKGITTEQLCKIINLGFDGNVWADGTVTVSGDGMFKELDVKLPYLKNVGNQQTVTVKYYNFGVSGNDDWDTYTPITTAEELQNINKDLSGNYVLMNDIDVAEETGSTDNNWTPIGNDTSPFTGKFSGGGHVVSEININNNSAYQGLFGYSKGVIKNVGVENSSISGMQYVGGICGQNETVIEGCYNTGNVRAREEAGGICGISGGTVQNCYNTGNISSDTYAGGICGEIHGAGRVFYCYNAGIVDGNIYMGSITVGGNGSAYRCYYSKDICSIGGINGSDITGQAEGISMEELCNITALPGFDTAIWENGSVTVNGNLRERIFPRLKNVGKQNAEAEVYKDYNFGVDGKDDWDTYTLIDTAAKLQAIGNDQISCLGNYVLIKDIDVAEETGSTNNNWTPIGSDTMLFHGKFSGNGHVVSGINIDNSSDYQGLFGFSFGVIKDVGIENSSIIGEKYIGGISGFNKGNIEGCYNTGNVRAKNGEAGGICGTHNGAKIQNCYNTGSVDGDLSGGICGRIYYGTISECYNAGKVSGRSTAGSICGTNGNGTIANCYNSKDICSIGGINGSDITGQAEGISMEELCNITALPGFDTAIWENGSVTVNGNLRERIFPRLKNVGKQNAEAEVYKDYNFGVDGKDDWDTYTPITDTAGLEAIGKDEASLSGNYVLMKDINVSEETGKTENNWTPIGELIGDPFIWAFTGKFSGDGHVISGININKPSEGNLGLFKNVGTNGIVKNVGLTDGSICGSEYVGGICPINSGTIENCFSSLKIYARDYAGYARDFAGGICAKNDGTINKCFNTGNILCNNSGGGICGVNSGSLSNSYNIGNIENYSYNTGGICGSNENAGSMKNCYNAGTLLYASAGGSICGRDYTGKIANCYYGKDICSSRGFNGSDEAGKAEGISTEELCNITALPGFESDVWENGSVISVSDNGRMRETVITFPHLKNVGEQQTKTVSYYNFGIDGKEDWQTYTPVTTLEELEKIGNSVACLSSNYVLMNDIIVPAGENNFTTLKNKNATLFTGKFSGNGHVISGININKPDENYNGLFKSSDGLIMELGITNSSIIGKEKVGAFCGDNDGIIWGCYSTGNTIECVDNYAGGICGDNNGIIWGCYSTGNTIECIDNYAGGICGRNQGGNISECYNTSEVSGGTFIGGIAGYNQEFNGIDAYGNITNCYNKGKLTSDTDSPDIGGITSTNISGCVVSDCYNTGSIVYSGDSDGIDEICINGGTVVNCYYNTDFCTTDSSCGTGLTTLEMVSGKMTGFDTSVWTKKSVDKAAKTAYYPTLAVFGNDNPISYDTKLDIALSPDSKTVYGGDYSFDISALVKFDGMTNFKADVTALTTGFGKYTVVCGDKTLCTGDIYDNTAVTATYSGRDIPRDTQTITLNYDGTGSDFLTSGTASLNADVTHTHTISEGYSYDETSHWKTCSGCDDKIDVEKHSFDDGVITTSSTEDEKTYTCKVCGYKKIENKDHQHKPSDEYSYDETSHWKTCSGCDEKLDLAKHSFDDGVITVPPTKTAEGEKVYTCTVCGYTKTEIIGKLAESYPIVISGDVTANKSNAEAGETVDVSAPFGYDIIVTDANGRQIAKITDKGSFKMPASVVVITAVRGEVFTHMANAWNHSYVYSYDSDMNRIKVNSDAKRGVITIDLGDDYAGRSFIIYSGRKNTSKKITEGVLDENGRFIFSADEGRNYTLVLD